MEILNPKAQEYVKKYTSPLDPVLFENERKTLAEHPLAVMHSGHVQGKFLEMLSLMIRPEKILEIGTFTGFSALCLVKGLREGGRLHTIEIREEDAATAAACFKEAGEDDQIKLHIGNAIDIIPHLNESWDLVFIDADKVSYIEYYELT